MTSIDIAPSSPGIPRGRDLCIFWYYEKIFWGLVPAASIFCRDHPVLKRAYSAALWRRTREGSTDPGRKFFVLVIVSGSSFSLLAFMPVVPGAKKTNRQRSGERKGTGHFPEQTPLMRVSLCSLDGLEKNPSYRLRWLSKKFDIQVSELARLRGMVASRKRRHTSGMLSISRTRHNAGDRTFCDAISLRKTLRNCPLIHRIGS